MEGIPHDQPHPAQPIESGAVGSAEINSGFAENSGLPKPEGLEAELRAKTSFFEAQVNSSIDGILVVDGHARKILQNRRMNELFGIPKEIADDEDDQKLRRWVVGLAKHPKEFLERVMHLYAHPDEIGRDEIELRDGRFLDRYSAPVIGKNGICYGRIWTFRDITARKRTEEALRETEEKFRQLVDTITDVIWMTSPDLGTIHYISPGYELVWGRPVESLYADPHQWADAILPEDRERVLAIFASLRENEAKVEIEYRIARPDGTVRWVYDRGFQVRDEAGNLVRLAGTVTDVTERKAAEARVLLQSAALEASANAIVITDHKGVIQWVNHAFTTLTGYDVADAIGRSPNILKSGRHDIEFYRDLWKTISAGNVWHGEMVNRRKDGTFYSEEMTITPMLNDRAEVTHYIAVKQDVTGRKMLETQLVDLSRQAGMAEVATGVLHNVGNVLNSLNVSANVLREQVRMTPLDELNQVVALLRRQGENLGAFFTNDARGPKVVELLARMAEMMTGLLSTQVGEVASMQKNIDHIKSIVAMQQSNARMAGLTESLVVTDLVEDTLRINTGNLKQQEVRVVRDYAAGVPAITTDKHKVLQILLNLVSNARAACAVMEGAERQITARVTHCDGRVSIQIIDNGAGIAPENLNRIFNHGFTTRRDGHGFGLHNSANAAKEIGGSLTVASEGRDRGAVFTLDLPVERRGSSGPIP
jgi:PAS domain S-box-containing protein